VRRLIINADDFGLTCGVNRAVLEAYRAGVITSTSLMANVAHTEEAAAMAHGAPRLAVGCHTVLIDGSPVLPARQIPSLLNSGGVHFRSGWTQFASAVLRGRVCQDEIAAEVRAQIRKLGELGLQLSHVDTHKHVHLLPAILEPVLQAARDCGIRAIRNPFAPLRPLALCHLLKRPYLWKRYTEVSLLRTLVQGFRRAVEAHGLVTTDGTFGIVVTGALDQRLFAAIAGSIPEGTWELACHPGYLDDELRSVRTRLRESRATELEVLTSAASREVMERSGVELISYREL
jgi:hopanoid biosynthesis associated protein HpnK